MDYFAGLDISMDETHVCVLDREGVVVYESKSESTAAAIAVELSKAPSCRRIVFETGRMALILFHGLSQLSFPVVCVESRCGRQALRSLATHKTDQHPDAPGLAHLACTGFFKPVHVKSLQAHALRSLISARKKLVGQRVSLENQIRGLAVVFGVRLPRALAATFIDNALKGAGEGISLVPLPPCGGDCGTNRSDDGGRRDRYGHETHDKSLGGLLPADDHPRRRPTDRARLCGRNRRSFAHPPIPETSAAYLGLVPTRHQSGELESPNAAIGGCGPLCTRLPMSCWTRTRASSNSRTGPSQSPSDQRCAKRESLWLVASRSLCTRCCETERSSVRPSRASHETGGRIQLPRGATPEGGSTQRREFRSTRSTYGRLRFQPSRAAPSLPHQVPNEHAENACVTPTASTPRRASRPLDPLENDIRK